MARQDFRKLSPKKQALIVFGILVGLLLAASGFLIAHWPFTEEVVTKELETASASRVEIEGFWGTYFPRPGCIARGVNRVWSWGEPGLASRTTINPNLPEQAAEILRGVDVRQAIPA